MTRVKHLLLPYLLLVTILAFTYAYTAYAASCKVVDPTWGVPAVVKPGEKFEISLGAPAKVLRVVATNGTLTYNLTIVKAAESKIEVLVPKSVKPGLYDLIVYIEGGFCGQPNALWVISKDLVKLVIMHITDEHYGVFNPTGRYAYEYDLAAAILALSNPNITIVVNTGDVADEATVEQYELARLVHWLVDKPTFIVPGNHDYVTADGKNYEAYVGPRRWYRYIGSNILLVGLDTGPKGYITLEQAKWFESVMKASKAKIKIMLHHYPLFAYVYGKTPHEFTVKTWEDLYKILLSKKPGSRYPYVYTSWLEAPEAFKLLVKTIHDYGLLLSLSGHIHLDSYAVVTRADGSKMWFVVTVAAGGPVRPQDYHGFKIVVVEPGKVKVLGFGEPWDRHASFNLELVKAHIRVSDYVSAVTFTVLDEKMLKLLPRLVLAVPILKSMVGKFKVYAPGFEKTWVKCTPLRCVLYALTTKVEVGKTYRLAVYTKPDLKPPVIEKLVYPETVEVGEPISVEFKVSDDSWGIAEVYAIVEGPGLKLTALPLKYGLSYRFTLPPIQSPGKVRITLVIEDYYGHRTEETFEITVVKPTPTTTKTTVKPSPTTTTTAKPTTTTTTTKPVITTKTTTKTATTTTPTTITAATPTITPSTTPTSTTPARARPAAPNALVIAGVVIAGVVAAAIAYLIAMRRG